MLCVCVYKGIEQIKCSVPVTRISSGSQWSRAPYPMLLYSLNVVAMYGWSYLRDNAFAQSNYSHVHHTCLGKLACIYVDWVPTYTLSFIS